MSSPDQELAHLAKLGRLVIWPGGCAPPERPVYSIANVIVTLVDSLIPDFDKAYK